MAINYKKLWKLLVDRDMMRKDLREACGLSTAVMARAFFALQEAFRAIDSTIRKYEKGLPNLKEGASQHTLLIHRIKALQIAASLITDKMES